ncbi:MAG TPA: zinc metallopeptidase [Candidatus Hydrogenedentes bacterium]|nr:zinc metallopeptidase [Candidatus Hydrogenedentota bacterium]HPG68707.1 zinc metallopeptidase [Candidatus Hydrogenedentota bacterium]
MFLYDSTLVLLFPALILAIWAQAKVKSTYAKYARVGVRNGLSGAELAQYIMRDAGIELVRDPARHPGNRVCAIESIPGRLSDHYDPRARTLRLSEAVYHGRSVAALGIAAHEVGHAIQHANMYAPLALRNVVYPVCNLGSSLAFPLFFIGLIARVPMLMNAAIFAFTFAVFFTVLTLPVEFNASRRALKILADGRYLDADELTGARKVLGAAAMTYVAAAAMAILNLVRMILISRD